MKKTNKNVKPVEIKYLSDHLFILFTVFFVLGILIYPQQAFDSAKEGIQLWFNTVFPSLLPFMIGANLLTEMGAVSFIGTLFEPIMRPLFKVPGVGAFAWIIGLTSGYPMGAKITADLRSRNDLMPEEAQRLISFSNNSGPLFIIGAISIGMLSNWKIGFFLLFIHYLSAVSMGIIFRFYNPTANPSKPIDNKHILKEAFKNLFKVYENREKKLGTILGDSIMSSMNIMVQIGGFIILFSVVARLLDLFSILDMISNLFQPFFLLLGFQEDLAHGWIFGFIEITNGAKLISQSSAPINQQLILISSIVAWSGISIIMQTTSIISHSDIKIGIYIFSKFIQSIFAAIYTAIFYPLVSHLIMDTVSTLKTNPPHYVLWTNTFMNSSIEFVSLLLGFMLLGIVISIIFYFREVLGGFHK